MRIRLMLLAVITMVAMTINVTAFAVEKVINTSIDSPIGYWKTIDDMTGRPKSIVQISKNHHQALIAKIIKIFPSKDFNQHKTCTACRGDKHNQPIVGMEIMSGLTLAENQWANGHILDPENGKTYKCTARLSENGKKLRVHGYLGLPLFGRSQTWERVDLMSG